MHSFPKISNISNYFVNISIIKSNGPNPTCTCLTVRALPSCCTFIVRALPSLLVTDNIIQTVTDSSTFNAK